MCYGVEKRGAFVLDQIMLPFECRSKWTHSLMLRECPIAGCFSWPARWDNWLDGGRRWEMRDYVNGIRKCWLCSSLSYPLVAPAFILPSLYAPHPLHSLCRMGDPVFFISAPGCRRPEALRHKQNTDKNTRRAMCWPLSQNSTNSRSFP